jgi:hypothetical protein
MYSFRTAYNCCGLLLGLLRIAPPPGAMTESVDKLLSHKIKLNAIANSVACTCAYSYRCDWI